MVPTGELSEKDVAGGNETDISTSDLRVFLHKPKTLGRMAEGVRHSNDQSFEPDCCLYQPRR